MKCRECGQVRQMAVSVSLAGHHIENLLIFFLAHSNVSPINCLDLASGKDSTRVMVLSMA